MSKGFLFLILIFSTSTFAQNGKEMKGLVVDPGVDMAPLKKTYPAGQFVRIDETIRSERKITLPVEDQAQFFEKAGLSAVAAKLDLFDRDMLVRHLRFSSEATIQAKYKGASLESIRTAKRLLEKEYPQ